MGQFSEYKGVSTLLELAKKPIDLTKEGAISEKRICQLTAKCDSLRLIYATERVNEKVMQALEDLAHQADVFSKMRAMQSGETINAIEGHESEDRAVLHTAMRNFFSNEYLSDKAKDAAKLGYAELEKLKAFLDETKKQGFTDLIQIGIGGSDLGPRAIYLALQAFAEKGKRVHFLSNVDPDDAAHIMQGLDLSKTLVLVVSKSGGTLETLTNEALVAKGFLDKGLSIENHFVAITGKGSPMDNPDKYRESFYIWDYVGGRYSVTSMVGCVMLSFALGMDKVLAFLKGAAYMDKIALKENIQENLPLLSALLSIWNRNFLGCTTRAVIPYSQALLRFPAHLQQCDMESNGKRIDKQGKKIDCSTGPVIWGEVGTNGQHSFYQLIHQGTDVIPVEFVGFRESQYNKDLEVEGTTSQEKLLANLFAQSLGLATGKSDANPNKVFPGNRQNRVLLAKRCDPYTLGMLLSYFEHNVAFQGFIWNINSFDQEGVQLGKVLANKIIGLFAKKKAGDLDTKTFPAACAYLKIIDQL